MTPAQAKAERGGARRLYFRNGSPDLRRQAVAELEKLGEVEVF